jgi:hypothetical protein
VPISASPLNFVSTKSMTSKRPADGHYVNGTPDVAKGEAVTLMMYLGGSRKILPHRLVGMSDKIV